MDEQRELDKKFPRKSILVTEGATEQESHRNFARMVTSPEVAAYRVVNQAEVGKGLGDQLDIPTLLEVLREKAGSVNKGDLSQAGAMLMNQATALQTLLSALSDKALTAGMLSQFEAYMRLALRAQSQCRATLETRAALKNPPIVYARQANVTTGAQQVNNGISRGESKTTPTELLETSDGERVDTGTTAQAVGGDPALEALDPKHRT